VKNSIFDKMDIFIPYYVFWKRTFREYGEIRIIYTRELVIDEGISFVVLENGQWINNENITKEQNQINYLPTVPK
jgi:hypothetical protein